MTLDEIDWCTVSVLVLSPIIGSFLGVLICRLPENRPIALSRSCCDHCGATLSARDLVPFLSFALAGGRCRACGAVLSRFYPAVEGAAFCVAVSAAAVSTGTDLIANCVLGWILLTLAWIDARTFLLPDRLTLPLIALGLAVAALMDDDLTSALIGAAAGYGTIFLLEITYRRLRGREGIGLGDAKLLAAAGAWLGWPSLPEVALLGSLTALAAVGVAHIIGHRASKDTAIPFGPFLALAIWIIRLTGPIVL